MGAAVSTGTFAVQNEYSQQMLQTAGTHAWKAMQEEENQVIMKETAIKTSKMAWEAMQEEENQKRAMEASKVIGKKAWEAAQDERNQQIAKDTTIQLSKYTA